MVYRLLLLLATSFALVACDSQQPIAKAPIPEVNQAAIQADIEFLSHDLLEGREAGTRGYQLAVQYLISQFRHAGLQPLGDLKANTRLFTQAIRFRQRLLDTEKTSLTVFRNGQATRLKIGTDFYTRGNAASELESVKAELVFVGYGIRAPHLDHNDYQGLDVEGKIVVVFNQRPSLPPSEESAHFASGRVRNKTAAEQGAVGIIYLQSPSRESLYSFKRIAENLGKPSLSWLDAEGNPGNHIEQLRGGALLSIEASRALLENGDLSYDQIVERAESNQPLRSFDLNVEAEIVTATSHREITSHNVVAMVKGSDSQLQNEHLIYTAHLDHIGLETHSHEALKSDDNINNGALDNASGTAIMLETARLFADNPPRRSVIFLAVTAEEKGLLGSDYFAQNPTIDGDSIVANINLDMPLLLYPLGDVIAFGSEHSTLANYVQSAVEKVGLQLSPDPMPEQSIFTRSDHYSFVKQGIPSVFLMPGFKSVDSNIDGGEIFQQFFAEHYHQPSDQFDLPIDYQSAKTFTQVNYLTGEEIANADTLPRWNENNFFGDTFGKRSQRHSKD